MKVQAPFRTPTRWGSRPGVVPRDLRAHLRTRAWIASCDSNTFITRLLTGSRHYSGRIGRPPPVNVMDFSA